MGPRLALLIAALVAQGCSRSPVPSTPSTPNRVWTDAELLDYVVQARGTSPSDVVTSAVLGLHHGTKLVQTIFNGDTSGPEDTARVLHYDLPERVDCATAGGVSKSLHVPGGYASRTWLFCFPSVLVEHWQETAPKMSPLDQTPRAATPIRPYRPRARQPRE